MSTDYYDISKGKKNESDEFFTVVVWDFEDNAEVLNLKSKFKNDMIAKGYLEKMSGNSATIPIIDVCMPQNTLVSQSNDAVKAHCDAVRVSSNLGLKLSRLVAFNVKNGLGKACLSSIT